jgi:hypothetical protein
MPHPSHQSAYDLQAAVETMMIPDQTSNHGLPLWEDNNVSRVSIDAQLSANVLPASFAR